MDKKRIEFKMYRNKETGELSVTQNKEGTLEEMVYAVKKPNHEQQRNANFQYSKFMNQYLKEGILPQGRLEETLKQNGVWDAEMENKEKDIVKVIRDVDDKLKRGGIKLSEAVKKAKEGIKARFELLNSTAKRNNLLNNSAERLSQNHRFNYLVSECTVYSNTDNRVFKDYDDFLKQDNLGSLLPYTAGENFSKLMYGFEDDFRKDWPEYKFLLKHKFVNDKLDFVNKDGEVVDIDGNKIEEVKEETKVEVPAEPEFIDDVHSSPDYTEPKEN